MRLLQSPEGSGYPAEYLVARICGRRGHFVRDWNGMLLSPEPLETLLPAHYRGLISEYSKEGIWKRMSKEYRWVYLQMNSRLREIFLPFFIYSEIKTAVLCFRYKSGKETAADVEGVLAFSLLSKEVRDTIMKAADMRPLLEEFEGRFLSPSARPRGLGEIFSKQGLKGVEEEMNNGCLENIIGSGLHPAIKYFFDLLADMRNIIALHKHIRWGLRTGPAFISGGSIGRADLERTARSRRPGSLSRLIFRLTAVALRELSASAVENTLLLFMTKRIRLNAKEHPDIGLLLDYLWRIHIETRNIGLVLYGRGAAGLDIRKELLV